MGTGLFVCFLYENIFITLKATTEDVAWIQESYGRSTFPQIKALCRLYVTFLKKMLS
jgi:hypothetical protein